MRRQNSHTVGGIYLYRLYYDGEYNRSAMVTEYRRFYEISFDGFVNIFVIPNKF